MSSNLDKLNDIYYDVESGFGGEEKLYSQAKAAGLTKGPGKLTRNDVKEWLSQQETVQVSKSFKRPTKFTSIRAKRVGEKYQTDLLDFGYKRNGYRFLLQVIDIHSRYAWSVPIPNKKAKTVTAAFKDKVLSEAKRKNGKLVLNHVHSDEGKEYLNSDFAALMEENGIRHTYSYEGEYAKNSLVERFNLTLRTLMEKMQGNFTVGKDSFQAIVRNYNGTKHRTIKAAPIDVWNRKAKNKQRYRDMLYGFKKGDRVRLLFKKKLFAKGTYGYSQEVYRISSIDKQKHYVKDVDGRQLRDKKGRKRYFMGYQLQHVDKVQKAKGQKKIAKEEKAAKKAKAAKKQKMKLAKEGLDDAAPVLKEKLRKKEVKTDAKPKAKAKAKAKTKAKAKKKPAKKKLPKGTKIEVKYRMDDGSTQWFKGEIVSERNDFYRVKFPGESGTQRYTFIDKKSPDYIEPASWRLVKS